VSRAKAEIITQLRPEKVLKLSLSAQRQIGHVRFFAQNSVAFVAVRSKTDNNDYDRPNYTLRAPSVDGVKFFVAVYLGNAESGRDCSRGCIPGIVTGLSETLLLAKFSHTSNIVCVLPEFPA